MRPVTEERQARSAGPLFEGLATAPLSLPAEPLPAHSKMDLERLLEPASAEARTVAFAVLARPGWRKAISISELVEISGKLNERSVKAAVEELRTVFRLPIGSRREKPAGYFWICSPEDQDEGTKAYRRQLITTARTLRILDSPERLRELLGQLQVELGVDGEAQGDEETRDPEQS